MENTSTEKSSTSEQGQFYSTYSVLYRLVVRLGFSSNFSNTYSPSMVAPSVDACANISTAFFRTCIFYLCTFVLAFSVLDSIDWQQVWTGLFSEGETTDVSIAIKRIIAAVYCSLYIAIVRATSVHVVRAAFTWGVQSTCRTTWVTTVSQKHGRVVALGLYVTWCQPMATRA